MQNDELTKYLISFDLNGFCAFEMGDGSFSCKSVLYSVWRLLILKQVSQRDFFPPPEKIECWCLVHAHIISYKFLFER